MPPRRWTDDDLRAAIAGARTWSDVLRELGLSRGGSPRAQVRRRAEQLGLDVSHLHRNGRGGRPRSWTDEQLTEAVATSRSLRQVFVKLDLRIGGGSWVTVQERIVHLGLATSHWDAGSVRPGAREPEEPVPDWTDDELRRAFARARSVRQVMAEVGLDPDRKRGRRELERRLRTLGLDVSALPGRGWGRGRQVPVAARRGRPLDQVLVRGSSAANTSHLRRRLIAEGVLAPRCASCQLTEWFGQPAPLQLDHVNGDRTDNRVENLRLLCANCHALTDTYCGRNIGGR